jgi:hypothetical protein
MQVIEAKGKKSARPQVTFSLRDDEEVALKDKFVKLAGTRGMTDVLLQLMRAFVENDGKLGIVSVPGNHNIDAPSHLDRPAGPKRYNIPFEIGLIVSALEHLDAKAKKEIRNALVHRNGDNVQDSNYHEMLDAILSSGKIEYTKTAKVILGQLFIALLVEDEFDAKTNG